VVGTDKGTAAALLPTAATKGALIFPGKRAELVAAGGFEAKVLLGEAEDCKVTLKRKNKLGAFHPTLKPMRKRSSVKCYKNANRTVRV